MQFDWRKRLPWCSWHSWRLWRQHHIVNQAILLHTIILHYIHTSLALPFPCSLLTSRSLYFAQALSLILSLPCSLLSPSLHYLSRCALLLTGKLLSSLLCCELNRGQQMREKHSLRRHGNPSLLLNYIFPNQYHLVYSHSSWLFEVADTTLSRAVTMVTI